MRRNCSKATERGEPGILAAWRFGRGGRCLQLFCLALLAIFLAYGPAAEAATVSVVKTAGVTIDIPQLNAGDHLVITGDALEPVEHTSDEASPEGDWAILRAIDVAYDLTIDTANTMIPMLAFCPYDFPNTSLTNVSLPKITTIGEAAFQDCASLTNVSLPAAETIGRYAFLGCVNLTNVSLPAADTIGNSAFYACENLTSVSLPAAETIGNAAFSSCENLTNVSLPAAETIGNSAFNGCENLTSVSLPAAKTIGDYAFNACVNLTNVSLPVAETIGGVAFYNCKKLTSVSLPAAKTIGGYAFYKCNNLTSLSLPSAEDIGKQAFYSATSLKLIILRADGSPITTTEETFLIAPPGILFITTLDSVGDMFTDTTNLSDPQILKMDADDINALTSAGAYVRSADAGGSVELKNILALPTTITSTKWYDGNDAEISGATNNTYTANASGVYTMKVVSDDANNIPVTYALPSNRVVIGTAPTIAGAESARYRTENLAMNEIFTLTGSEISLDVSSPLASITVAHSGNSVTLAGDLPDETAEYVFTLHATNPYAYWSGEHKKFTHLAHVTAVRTVTFESNGGSAVDAISADIGGMIDEPDAPTRDGYNFVAWFKEAALTNRWAFDVDTVPGDMTLYADWTELIVHTVTFDSMGGSTVDDIRVEDGDTVPRPTQDPTYTGHTFDGWYADTETTTPWDFDTPVTEDTTLYAKWTEVTYYTVAFNADGGTPVPDAQSVASGDLATKPSPNPAKSGYNFVAWYNGSTPWDFNTPITASITLTAQWSTDPVYTVTFNSNGGSTVDSKSAAKNTAITEPTAPKKSGYTFAGWYKESTLATPWLFATDLVTANITLYAKWDEIAITAIGVAPTSASLRIGDTQTFTASCTPADTLQTGVTWRSTDESVATVSATGFVTALAAGTTEIVATSTANTSISGSATVTVTPSSVAVTSVGVTPNSTRVQAGRSHQLTADVQPANAPQGVTWTSPNTSIATVDETGLVTAIAAGEAIIAATSVADNTKSGTATIVVTTAPTVNDALSDKSGNGVVVDSPILPDDKIDTIAAETGISNPMVIETTQPEHVTTKAAPSAPTSGERALASSVSIAIPASDGNILPMLFDFKPEVFAEKTPNWGTLSNAERVSTLEEDDDGLVTTFCYEYVTTPATAPVRLIGNGGLLSWNEAIASGVAEFGSAGDVRVNYTVVNGSGNAFVKDDMLIIYDNDGDESQLTDPAWLMRGARTDTGTHGSSGCANGAGGLLALLTVAALPMIARRGGSKTRRG